MNPEEVDTLELSFDYRFPYDLGTQINIFHYSAEDLITFVPSTNSSTAQNSLGQDGVGMELETNWKINN